MEIVVESIVKDGEKIYAVSSNSPFYVDFKGGQLGDRGYIGDAKVLGVFEKDRKIYHRIDKEIKQGILEVFIDEKHRGFVRAHHTAQHILSASLHEIADINTVGFRMGFEYTTIDLDVPFIEDNVLQEAEILSNEIVRKCYNVEEIWVKRFELDKFNLRRAVSDKVKGDIRIIKIEDFDYSPCGGFHVKNTGEIGIIKILRKEKVKGNLTRVYFVASSLALSYFQKYNKILGGISKSLTSSVFELEEKVSKTLEDLKMYASKVERLSQELAKYKIREIKSVGDVYYLEGEKEILRYIPKFFDKKDALLILFDGKSYSFTSTGKYNVGEIIMKLKEIYGGTGGGGRNKGNYISNIGFNRLLEVIE
ncbi:threonyl-tRNA synthetase [Thermosipho sp. 1063]|uniref:alanyl-tRNA editing protein n=1 Tax=unclassified Thermosipho (in: thermotogales) TaxID=2676525 RepID=UPI0009492E64|nr:MULTISPECIES: alanyl-tRNA editing protein [unclassified Thermosipho (in: thermotogales)]ANQ53848.1 threonyl-tRNA synthetase [Thermosipho sp. 1070]APT72294.1 threonyl-tRNA synthetase [Thermosipho sp. 1063]